ncbi:hypothetical protein ETAA8_38960 [Anatilimnocola aggregata]|uniref:Uncharacterized protein n=1 Tax=Anatilimnocola aggregata TaxID=2528021 RepID=A0A517YF11_9BACT|nr:hypothetical protein [Anatilimnocola aggregata]QDU28791.1 hypothetical protein ETAA8_38960 [Anatilimnocola aggregata]
MQSSMRKFATGVMLTGLLACADPSSVRGEPTTRETLEKLTAEEKNVLLQKKERFEAMSAEEQDRMRNLNAAIASSDHREQLHSTLDRYHEWLKTLTTKQRADLLELSSDQRIGRIKELMQEQERSRLRDLGGKQLPEADIDAIFSWLDEFMKAHEEQYMERLPKDYADRLKGQEEVARRRSLMRGIIMRGPRSDFPMPIRDDLERLLPTLSQATRLALESAKTPDEKQMLARQWIFTAMISKVLPQVSDEELQKVFKEMRPDERERLERKSPEEAKRELTWRFHWQQWPSREGWRGGMGGPGFPGSFRPGMGGPGGPVSAGPGGGPPGPERKGSERDGSDRGPGGPGGIERGRGGPGRGGFGPSGERPPPSKFKNGERPAPAVAPPAENPADSQKGEPAPLQPE